MGRLNFGLAVSAVALLGSAAQAADEPPPALMAFIGGTMLNQAIDVCHLDATPAQRVAMASKLAQLKTQLPAGISELPPDAAIKPSDCPADSKKPQFSQLIPTFIDKPSEQFVVVFQQVTEGEAQAAPVAQPTPAAAPAAAPAPAAAETTVGGWQVTQRPNDGLCSAVRGYKDPDDDNKENAVAFMIGSNKPDTIIVSLAYEGWDWDKDEKVTADFKADKTMLLKKSSWTATKKTVLASAFDGADVFLDKVGGGKKLFLTFAKDSEANFLIPNAGLALGAMKLCLAQK